MCERWSIATNHSEKGLRMERIVVSCLRSFIAETAISLHVRLRERETGPPNPEWFAHRLRMIRRLMND